MAIKNLVSRELAKIRKNIDTVKENIDALPKGSLVLVTRDNNAYYYLKHREGDKVHSFYVGKENEANVLRLQIDIERRRKLEEKLRKLRKEEQIASRMLKVRD